MSKAAELAALIANVNKGSSLGNKNFFHNGMFQVAQRGTSSTAEGFKTVDRWQLISSNEDNLAFTQAQSSDVPSGYGFTNSFKIDCTTVESALAADEHASVSTAIEAQDLAGLGYGASGAKAMTLSFWVKSNKTGNYAVSLYKVDNTERLLTVPYTISSADTWEKKELAIPGDTSGGAINNDNGAGIHFYFMLMAGSDYTSSDSTSWGNYSNAGFAYGQSVNMFDNTANEWLITGCQLEIGEKATAFEHESYEATLRKCLRYHYEYTTSGLSDNPAYFTSPYSPASHDGSLPNSSAILTVVHPVPMRAAPSHPTTTINTGSLNRDTSTIYHTVYQLSSSSANDAQAVTAATITAEL